MGPIVMTLNPNLSATDPSRLIHAVIVGISFLGAGTILHRERSQSVEGLTTAASVLLVAGMGAAVALDLILTAFALTFIVIITLIGLGIFEGKLIKPLVEREAAKSQLIFKKKEKKEGKRSSQT
jgi:putative Mg2+ transporter-C (MgtC) family protein